MLTSAPAVDTMSAPMFDWNRPEAGVTPRASGASPRTEVWTEVSYGASTRTEPLVGSA